MLYILVAVKVAHICHSGWPEEAYLFVAPTLTLGAAPIL